MKLALVVSIGLIAAVLAWALYLPRFSPEEPAHSVDPGYHYARVDCWFRKPRGVEIDCGRLHTAEATGRFALPVVVIRAEAEGRRPDPLLYLQGGPGGSAWLDTEGIRYWHSWLDAAQLNRDLVLLDMRGAGRSEPALSCPEHDRFSRQVLARDLSMTEELNEGEPIFRECFTRLAEGPVGFDPSHFGTWVSARDVRELMALLDYQQWNLLGVSYGSRLAMAVALTSPDVRTLILDSVYPLDRGGLRDFPQVVADALNDFFAWCSQRDSCDGGDDLQELFYRALAQLREAPISMRVQRWNWEPSLNLMVNDQRLLSAIFSGIYDSYLWPEIPAAIRGVLAKDTQAITPLMETFINNALAEDFNSLVFAAVDCRDHPPESEQDYLASLADHPRLAPYLRDLWRYQSCHYLETEEKSFGPDGLPSVPALLLAGELDPITPANWARELHRQWPDSQLYISPDQGHGVIGSHTCVHENLREFLDHPQQPWRVCEE